jgi:quinol monooxygenase YgiN
MSTKTVTVVAQVQAKPGRETELRKELRSLLGPSRSDAGCINYDLHQRTDDPHQFLLYENWASQDHLTAHLQQPHVQSLLNKLKEMAAEPPSITLWENVG